MKKTILTVDDSITIRQMVSFTLQSAGFHVVEAVDGEDARTKLSPPPDMVITDLNMPRLDGIGVIQMVRGNPSTKFVPIVVLTTESDKTKKQQASVAGATAWIVKPFRPEQLTAVVQKVLG